MAPAFDEPSIRAREIQHLVEKQVEGTVLISKDVYNWQQARRLDMLEGYTSTGYLKVLDDENISHKKLMQPDDPDQLMCLIWCLPAILEMTRRFPDVTYPDLTYKTNRFNLPFYQTTSLTSCNTSFSQFLCVVDNGKEEAFDFLFQATKDLRQEYGIPDPYVIVTDSCKEMKNSLARIFPNVQQRICIFHLLKNILFNAKAK